MLCVRKQAGTDQLRRRGYAGFVLWRNDWQVVFMNIREIAKNCY